MKDPYDNREDVQDKTSTSSGSGNVSNVLKNKNNTPSTPSATGSSGKPVSSGGNSVNATINAGENVSNVASSSPTSGTTATATSSASTTAVSSATTGGATSGGAAAGGATAGSAGGPVGAIVGLALGILLKAKDDINKDLKTFGDTKLSNINKAQNKGILVFIITLVVLLPIFAIINRFTGSPATMSVATNNDQSAFSTIGRLPEGSFKNKKISSINLKSKSSNDFFSSIMTTRARTIIAKTISANFLKGLSISNSLKLISDLKEFDASFDPAFPLRTGLSMMDMITECAFKSAYAMAEREVKDIIESNEYDYDLTMESFYNNDYPFEDINKAEFFNVISQCDSMKYELINWEDFYAYIQNYDKMYYLYEMKVEEKIAIVKILVTEDNIDTEENEEVWESKEAKYGEVTLLPYSLSSLYNMIEKSPTEMHAYWKKTLIDILPEADRDLRYYARCNDEGGFDLGKNVRTPWDWGLETTKGRTYHFDIVDIYDDSFFPSDINSLDFDKDYIADERFMYLLQRANSKIGGTYRMGANDPVNNIFDCSSYMSYVFEVDRTTAQGLYNMSTKTTELKPGVLIFFTGTYAAGRVVTHVGMYIGNGNMIHAGNPIGVVSIKTCDYWKDHFYGIGELTN